MIDWRVNKHYYQPRYDGTIPVPINNHGMCPQADGFQHKKNYSQPYLCEKEQDQNVQRIHDWLGWSLLNLIIGWGFIGLIPLILSIICRKKKKINNYVEAHSMGKLALIFNIIITTIGAIGWIVLIVVMVLYSWIWKRTTNKINNFISH
ncbi:unnamed protein product [Rotaria sp. Silwood2]|nr:unnamed protein product [Rotaria sp. Silwood2]CAF4194790.1 unnamed protein product [Rotaria sp. Silwood2]CAF4240952.1 unnamed protein product [Rotaria sp. Silwood2]